MWLVFSILIWNRISIIHRVIYKFSLLNNKLKDKKGYLKVGTLKLFLKNISQKIAWVKGPVASWRGSAGMWIHAHGCDPLLFAC